MATVKLKFRKSRIESRGGIIYYQITHRQRIKHITTTMRVCLKDFEKIQDNTKLYDMEPSLRLVKSKVDSDLHLLNEIIKDYDKKSKDYTVPDIIECFHSRANHISFFGFMDRIIKGLHNRGKMGTASNYTCAMRSFSKFLHGEDISITLVTEALILNYNDWLEMKKIEKNSISFYMRILRAVYNRAVVENLVVQTFPFANVYTGIDQTRKLAIEEECIIRLMTLDLSKTPGLAFSRDLFIFSYSTRGMAFVDIAFLKKEDINNNVLTYKRKKTAQLMSVKMEPCMVKIIQKYQGLTEKSEFVFPILNSQLQTDLYQQYHTALTYHNRKLKKIASLAGISANLSSYTARHSWATIARNHNVPLSVISKGMGHSTENTTRIYLASLENSVIDDANSLLVSNLNNLISF